MYNVSNNMLSKRNIIVICLLLVIVTLSGAACSCETALGKLITGKMALPGQIIPISDNLYNAINEMEQLSTGLSIFWTWPSIPIITR